VTVSGVPAVAPTVHRPVIFDQRWCDLTFLHWPVDPAAVRRFFPPGTRPDVVDGVTYVGLVPFSMRRARLGTRLPVPYLGSFAETNVRLYSVDAAGRHGVVFRTLDCSRLAVTVAARAVGVPYVWSRVAVSRTGESLRYVTGRRRGAVTSTVEITPGEAVEPTDLEIFLTARWGMHAATAGVSYWVPNHHGTWPLREATLRHLDDDLVTAAGIEPVGPMLRPLFTTGVHARFGLPRRVPGR
jgi:uncharacterized protein YqjF (DUF2071 family)